MDRDYLTRSHADLWWLGVIQGILAIFFGFAAIFWPGLTLLALLYLFGAFALVWGIVEVIRGLVSVNRRDSWWLSLVFGLVSLGVGVYLITTNLDVSLELFMLLVGLVLILRGIFDAVSAFVDRDSTTNKVLSVIVGLAAIAAGIFILLQPVTGGVAFVWILGLYALVYGTLLIAASIGMHETLGGSDNEDEATDIPVRRSPASRSRRVR